MARPLRHGRVQHGEHDWCWGLIHSVYARTSQNGRMRWSRVGWMCERCQTFSTVPPERPRPPDPFSYTRGNKPGWHQGIARDWPPQEAAATH